MKYLKIPAVLLCALSPLMWAEEITLEPAPFEATVKLDGVLLPSAGHILKIELDRWTELKILGVKEQGAAVKEGEAVVTLDLEGIDRKIADDKVAAKLRSLALKNAERELANLKQSTTWKLEVAKRNFERTKEDLEYFKTVSRPMGEEATARSVERSKRSLENQEEELRQLLKMYEEDDLTEETEEIILKRQKNAVDDSKYAVRRAEISANHTLEVELPRQATDLAQGFKDAELIWTTHSEILPRALEQKSLEVEKMRVENKRAREAEAEVLADRGKLAQKSPVAGRVYYGEIENGRWIPANAVKFMKVGGLVPSKAVYATVVPESAAMELHAFAEEGVIAGVQKAKEGYFSPTAAPRSRIPLTLKSAAVYPGVDSKYHVELTPSEGLKEHGLVAGMKGKITLITKRLDNALVVPVRALKEESDGTYTVKIKLADGASESRVVALGTEANGKIEILSGLEAGQVVLVGGEKK